MKLIPLLLLVGMLAVSGWAKDAKPEPYSAELVKRAEAGNAKAQYSLGHCYYCGEHGVAIDHKEAVKWWTKSAEQGNADAQLDLGGYYYNGTGVTKDYIEMVMWLRKGMRKDKLFLPYAIMKAKALPKITKKL